MQPTLLRIAACASALVLVAGCNTMKVSDRQIVDPKEKIARPDRILVYDFTTNAADLPAGSALVPNVTPPDQPPTEKEVEAGRALGKAVAKELVAEINKMGLQAVVGEGAPAPAIGDIAIYGAFISVDEGSAAKRIVVGFGSGSADVKTFVEGFLMTDRGLRRLGSGELNSGGNKSPGVAVPFLVTLATANPIGLVVGGAAKAYGEISGSQEIEGAGKRTAAEIAKELKVRFVQQGWISG